MPGRQGGRHDDARSWSPEEDARLLQLHTDFGAGRWKEISRLMGDANPRTPAMVRNRYLRIMKGRSMAESGAARNKCGKCGLIKRGHVCKGTQPVATCSATEQAERHREARAALTDISGALTLAAPNLEGDVNGQFPVATAVVVGSSITPTPQLGGSSSSADAAEPAPPPSLTSGFQQEHFRTEQSLFAPLAESLVSPAVHDSIDVSPVSVSPVMLAEMIKLATQEDTPTGLRQMSKDFGAGLVRELMDEPTRMALSGEQ